MAPKEAKSHGVAISVWGCPEERKGSCHLSGSHRVPEPQQMPPKHAALIAEAPPPLLPPQAFLLNQVHSI